MSKKEKKAEKKHKFADRIYVQKDKAAGWITASDTLEDMDGFEMTAIYRLEATGTVKRSVKFEDEEK